jgi:hypothetical protein
MSSTEVGRMISSGAARAGWYPDPRGRFRLRYYDGNAWTGDVVTRDDAMSAPPREPAPTSVDERGTTPTSPADAERIHHVLRFLDEELEAGRLPINTYRTLRANALSRLRSTTAVRSEAVAATPTPTAPRQATPVPQVPPRPQPRPIAVSPAKTVAPGPVFASWRSETVAFFGRLAATVRTDLAVHGLAYLGVLLVFAGVFGFVVFAFGEVSTALRPVAELAIPLAVFSAAAFLHHRGSRLVAAALELLGGALVPIIAVASFVDGASVPPDPHGDVLAIGLGVAMLVVALVYALVARRRPESPLRFFVAPVVWLGVALALSPTVRGGETGSAIARPSAWQMAITAVTVFVTALLARLLARRSRSRAVAVASELVVLPGLAVVVALEAVGLARAGWPGWPVVLTSLAVVATVEVQAPRLPAAWVAPLEALAAGGVAVGIGLETGRGWGSVAAVIALLGVAEWNGRRRPTRWIPAITIAPATLAVALAFEDPWAAVVATGVATAWAHFRRIARVPWFDVDRDFLDIATVAVSVAFAAALVEALGPSTGLLVVAGLLAVTSFVVRATPARRQTMWSWAVPIGAMAALVAVLATTDAASSDALAAAATLLAVAATVATAPAPVRVWTASAAWVAAVGLAFDQLGVARPTAAAALGAVGLLMVGISVTRRGAIPAQLGAVGITLGATTTAVALGDQVAATVVTIACGTAAWILVAVAEETGRWSTSDVVPARFASVLRQASAGFGLIGLAATALMTLRVAAGESLSRAVVVGVFAGSTLLGALCARALRRRSVTAASLAWSGALLGLVGLSIAAADGDDALTAVVSGVVALSLVVVVPGDCRGRVLAWVGWLLTAVSTTFVAFAVGLPRRNTEVAVFGWGALVLVGALAFDDSVAGRRSRGQLVRDARAVAPGVLGLAAVVAGAVAALDAQAGALGWWALAGAGVALVLAVQLREAVLSTLGYALLAPAMALLAPGTLPDDPWSLVVLATAEVLLGVAVAVAARGSKDPLDRWDVPPFVVGNVVALVVVGMATEATSPMTVYLVMGIWSLTLALVVRPRLHTWATPWVVAGAALLDVAAGWAGPGWLTGALVATSAVATMVAARLHGPSRTAMQAASALSALGAGIAGLWWWDPAHASAVVAAAVAGGVTILAVVCLVRWARVSSDWLPPWAVVALGVLGAAGVGAVDAAMPEAGIGLAVGVTLAALASALAAAPLGRTVLRDVAAVLLPGALALALVAVDASLDAAAAVAGATGFAAVLVASTLLARRPTSPWVMPALVLAGIGVGGAVGVGIADLPDRGLLVAALALAGAAAAVVGVVSGRLFLLTCAPVLLCGAWLVFASEALTGNAQWFTVPIGLTLLVVEGLIRAALRARSENPHTPVTLDLDYVGLSFLVGASVMQIATTSAWYVFAGVALGAMVCAWGAVTKVVHRAWFGAGVVVLSLLVAIALPTVEFVPQLEGAALWISIAAVGFVALVIAAFLEQGRRTAEAGIARLRDLTSSWER